VRVENRGLNVKIDGGWTRIVGRLYKRSGEEWANLGVYDGGAMKFGAMPVTAPKVESANIWEYRGDDVKEDKTVDSFKTKRRE
jgi:hypothetical protein